MHQRNPKVRIVPIALRFLSLDNALVLGHQIAEVIRHNATGTLIVASTDLNHFEDQETTRQKDQLAIDCIAALDPEGLYATVLEHDISMCGVIPTTVTLAAANRLGASRAKIVKQATSGDVGGGYESVVGYASAMIT